MAALLSPSPSRPTAAWGGLLAAALLVSACSAPPSPRSDTPSPESGAPASGSATVPAPAVPPPADVGAGPAYPAPVPSAGRPTVREGDDWTVPAWARPAPFSGFFSEDASLPDQVAVRSVDVSWAQVAPTEDGPLDLTATGEAQGMFFDSLSEQLAEPGPYWLRMFSSGAEWAPDWVVQRCGVEPIGTDYDGQQHLPIWDDCVWAALRDTWEKLLLGQGILEDPDFRFAYVPGGFTWSEFDYEMMNSAARKGELTKADYLTWFDQMVSDLVALAGDRAGQLVFTGEDYPWSSFAPATDLLAADAVAAGLGVRTGITELSNFHLSQAPAYGSTLQPDGHLTLVRPADTRPIVFGTENECYTDCGYHSADPRYAVVQSNLKALQLQMNWMYVVPGPSLLDAVPEHWDWVRLSLGQPAGQAPDAWAALRDAEDRYLRDRDDLVRDDSFGDDSLGDDSLGEGGWRGRPFVRNLERWLVQVDVPGRAVSRRSTVDVHRGDPERENGTAYEGLRVDGRSGSLAFRVDPLFLDPATSHDVLVKVTYLDAGTGSLRVRTAAGLSPAVALADTGSWRTATFRVRLRTAERLPDRTDLWLVSTQRELTVRFVRVLRLDPPA